jgi:beta-glucosidase
MDRTRLDLPEAQTELLARAAEANPNVVVALSNGGVVDVAAWDHRTPAVLEGWLLGQAGGSALADLLFGVVAPSGKLAETIPLRLEDGPSFGNFPGDGRGAVEYGERTLVGYRWYQTRGLDVAYPFGHGLTYTAFEYSDAWIEVLEDGAAPSVAAHVTVKNVGERAGREVAQVYVHDRSASVERPDQELRAFTGVTLAPGESRDVTFLLDARAFAFWDVALDRWFVEGGEFEIRIGSSSADIRETAVVELSGDPVTRPLTLDSTLEDWLTDPSRGPWLVSRLDGTPFAGLATDPATRDLMGFTPMARMTRFPGFPVTIAEVEAQALI